MVAAPAEIDLSNAGHLLGQLLTVLQRGPAVLIIDMSVTRFCDSAGVNAILRARKRAEEQGAALRVAASAHSVRRVFALTGVDRVLDVYPSLAAALAAPPAGGTKSGHNSHASGPAAAQQPVRGFPHDGGRPQGGAHPQGTAGSGQLEPPEHAGDSS